MNPEKGVERQDHLVHLLTLHQIMRIPKRELKGELGMCVSGEDRGRNPEKGVESRSPAQYIAPSRCRIPKRELKEEVRPTRCSSATYWLNPEKGVERSPPIDI